MTRLVNLLGDTFQPGSQQANQSNFFACARQNNRNVHEGQTYSEISHEMIISDISTIKHIIVQYANTGSFSPNKPSAGKRSACTNEIIQFMEYLFSTMYLRAESKKSVERLLHLVAGVTNISAVTTVNDVIRNHIEEEYLKL